MRPNGGGDGKRKQLIAIHGLLAYSQWVGQHHRAVAGAQNTGDMERSFGNMRM